MALTTYSELQAHIATKLFGRDDLTDEIVDAIRLTESHLNSRLFVRQMDAVSPSLTITNGEGDVPADLQSVHSARLTVTPYTALAYEPIEVIEQRRPDTGGTPQVYDIVGEKIVVWPPTSSTVKLRYRQDIPALADDNTDNWLLTRFPHVYVYGAMYFISLEIKEEAEAQRYAGLFQGAIEELNDRAISMTSANLQTLANTQVV